MFGRYKFRWLDISCAFMHMAGDMPELVSPEQRPGNLSETSNIFLHTIFSRHSRTLRQELISPGDKSGWQPGQLAAAIWLCLVEIATKV